MSDINSFAFSGRLGRDPETRYTASGTAMWKARVANDVGSGQRKATNWISVTVFGKQAEVLGGFTLAKGSRIGVTGELRINEYTTKNGEKRTDVEVNAQQVTLLDKRDDAQPAAAPAKSPAPPQPAFEDDDIPF